MNPSFDASLIDAASKDAFWGVVEDCVVKIHHLKLHLASTKLSSFRSRLALTGDGSDEIIYHDEPFYVACDIAGLHDAAEQDRLLGKYDSLYTSILNAHGW